MRIKHTLAAVIAATLVVGFGATPANAQAQKEDWELTLSGSATNGVDFDGVIFSVDGQLGYYVTDQVEISLIQGFQYSDINVSSSLNGRSGVAVDYHFDAGDWRPFVGGTLSFLYGDGTSDTFSAGPQVGVKYYVSEEAFVFGKLEYQFLFDSGGDINDNFNDGAFFYTLGVGLNF